MPVRGARPSAMVAAGLRCTRPKKRVSRGDTQMRLNHSRRSGVKKRRLRSCAVHPAPAGDGSLDRSLRATLVALLVGCSSPPRASPRPSRPPRASRASSSSSVRSARLTGEYRALANEAAAGRPPPDRRSSRSTPRTPPGPRSSARSGASIVVYLGHGNGWPSRVSRLALPADPERLRAQPGRGRRRQQPPVLRRGVGRDSSSRRTPSSCCATSATRAATASRGCRRAASRWRSSASTTTRRASCARAPGRRRRGLPGPRVLREALLRAGSIERSGAARPAPTATRCPRERPDAGLRRAPGPRPRAAAASTARSVLEGPELHPVRSGATGTTSGTTSSSSSIIQPPVTPSLTSLGRRSGR